MECRRRLRRSRVMQKGAGVVAGPENIAERAWPFVLHAGSSQAAAKESAGYDGGAKMELEKRARRLG